MNRKGLAPLFIIGIIALITLAGVGIRYFVAYRNPAPPGGGVACTMEAKLCPDGSYVGRTGPNCEFAACPTVASSTTPTSTATSTTRGRGAGAFCGGIATGAFPCDPGYTCKLDGTYPDSGGHCIIVATSTIDTANWKTYISQQYSFSLKYPSNFTIQSYPGYKMNEFNICQRSNCQKVLRVDIDPLDIASGTYINYHEIQAPDYLRGIFYYYSIETGDSQIDQVLSTFKFIQSR